MDGNNKVLSQDSKKRKKKVIRGGLLWVHARRLYDDLLFWV